MKKFTKLLSLLFFLQVVWSSSIYGQVNKGTSKNGSTTNSSAVVSRTGVPDPVSITNMTKSNATGNVAVPSQQIPVSIDVSTPEWRKATNNGTGKALVFPTNNVVKRNAPRTTTTTKVSALGFSPPPITQTFNFTGGMQTWTVPAGVTSITIDTYGAQGGTGATGGNASSGGIGGLGTQATGTLAVTPGQVLNIFVGGQGGTPTAGFNEIGRAHV